jgi:hypothetical protein
MVRSMGEATRLVKQGAVNVGGCIPPCNMRMPPFKCSCGGWKKATDFREDLPTGMVIRVGKGDWRLLIKEDDPNAPPVKKGKNHHPGFNQLRGIGWVPVEKVEIQYSTVEPKDEPCQVSPEAV